MKSTALVRTCFVSAALIGTVFATQKLQQLPNNHGHDRSASKSMATKEASESGSATDLSYSDPRPSTLTTSPNITKKLYAHLLDKQESRTQTFKPATPMSLVNVSTGQSTNASPGSNPGMIPGDELFKGTRAEGTDGSYLKSSTRQTDFHYPLVRIDQRITKDANTNQEVLVETKQLVADHLVVLLNDLSDEAFVTQQLKAAGFGIRRKAGYSGAILASFPVTHAFSLEDALKDAESIQSLATVEPDYIVNAAETPNDELYYQQKNALNQGYGDTGLTAERAWNIRKNANNVVVAIVDSGVDFEHPDLTANMWSNPKETANGIDDDGNGYVDDIYGINVIDPDLPPLDDRFHGTHVAGTIGAVGNNGIGITGVAWSTQLMACKFLDASGNGATSGAAECIAYATAMGADVINASYTSNMTNSAESNAIAKGRNKNVVVVAAAGNNNTNIDDAPQYPASYDYDNIVSVGASDLFLEKITFSNYGQESVDIAAVGSRIFSTFPSIETEAMTDRNLSPYYGFLYGTSMAAPQVAGAIAILKAEFPGETYLETIDRLLNNSDTMTSWEGLSTTGGVVNLFQAIDSVVEQPSPLDVCSATASDNDGNLPINAVDGKMGTRWSALGREVTLDLELCATTSISNIKIAWFKGDVRKAKFSIQVSADGTNWTTVKSGQASGTTSQFESYPINSDGVNYVRIIGKGNNRNSRNSIKEIKFEGEESEWVSTPDPDPETDPDPNTGGGLSTDQHAICDADASTQNEFVPANAIDGDLNTRWSGRGVRVPIILTLCEPTAISEVQIAWFEGDQRTANFDIQIRNENQKWKTVTQGPSSGTTSDFESYEVNTAVISEFRLIGRANSENNWNSINEIRVLGSN